MALALPAFAMQSPTAMAKYGANNAEIRNGTFYPTGDYAFKHPTGTGPMKFQSWTVGQSVVLVKNKQYWGKSRYAKSVDRIIIRPISNNTARVQALQNRRAQHRRPARPAGRRHRRGQQPAEGVQPARRSTSPT